MKLTVKGIRGADFVELEFAKGKITLLAGENAQGKSSIIEAAQAVLGAKPVPDKQTNKYGEAILNDGHKDGFAKLQSDHGERTVSYPQCEVKTNFGSGLTCDDFSLGVKKLMNMPEKERANMLVELTGSKVTRERIIAALTPLQYVSENTREQLCVTALSNSFEVASNRAKDAATTYKGEFKAATGEQWGSVKGLTFKPAGWEDDLDKQWENEADLLESLAGEAAESRKRLEEAIGRSAVAKAAAEYAGKQDQYAKEIEEWTQTIDRLTNEVENLRSQAVSQTARTQSVTCGGCGIVGVIEQNVLVEKTPASTTPAQNVANEELKASERRLSSAQHSLGIAKANFDRALEAANATVADVDLAAYRAVHDRDLARYSAWKKKEDGTRLHWEITDLLKAAEILSPEGLPRVALNEALESLNKNLRTVCERAGWSSVEIGRDLVLTYNGRPYRFASTSEKYRADASVQMLFARMLKQEIVIFDAADVLDAQGRNHFFSLLAAMQITAIVGMTVFKEKDGTMRVPDLAKHGLGTTYLVSKGTVKAMVPA